GSVWQRKIGQGGRLGGIQWGVSADDRRVYAAVSDVEITAPPPGGAGGRPSVFGMPLMLSPKAGGGLYALDVATGDIAWHTPHPGCGSTPGCSPAQSAATTVMPGVVLSAGPRSPPPAPPPQDGPVNSDTATGPPLPSR